MRHDTQHIGRRGQSTFMKRSLSSLARTWGWRSFFTLCLVGIGLAIAQDFFPSLRHSYNPDHFCRALPQGTPVEEVQRMLITTGYQSTQESNEIRVSVRSGCACVIHTNQQRVTSAAQLCND